MEDVNKVKFAITARSNGVPRKLYTPIYVMNLDASVAASVNAMWDTGAEMCIMSKALADFLGVQFNRKIRMRGILDDAEAPIGKAYVSLACKGGIVNVEVSIVEGRIGGDQYSFIIGLNLISMGSFSLSCENGDMVLSFTMPALDAVDYSKDVSPSQYMDLSSGQERLRIFRGRETLQLLTEVGTPEMAKRIIDELEEIDMMKKKRRF